MQIVYTSTNYKGAVYKAILAIVLGAVLLVWPGTALKYIVMLIGTVFLVTGLIAFIVSNRDRQDRRKSLVPFSGIGSMVLGVLLLCLPSTFAAIFMFVLGFFLVFAAVGQFFSLVSSRRFGHISPVAYLFPLLILVAGIVVLFNPFESAESVFILFGITSVFYGITDLSNQYSIRRMRKAMEEKEQMGNGTEVEDAEYEEVK